MHQNFIKLTFITLLFTTGCQLLPPYQGPLTPTPDHWKIDDLPTSSTDLPEPSFEEVCAGLDNWWEVFQDPVLNQLEEQALVGSYSLWAALERVLEARDKALISRAALMPGINFAPSFSRSGSLIQTPFSNFASALGGTTTPGTAISSSGGSATAIPNIFRFVQTECLVPFDLSYEIDLWSQLDNAYYATLIRAQAASQAYLSVLLSLTANIASNYFQLRSLDAQQAVIQTNIKTRQDEFEINSARFRVGLISYLDVSRAELELARAKSDSEETYRLRGLQENILAALVGVPAPVFAIEYNPLSALPPVIPAGLPSELLCRRPDIGEAERDLAAAYRDIGVAYANFFPSLTLNGALGAESPVLHNLFSWRARFWDVGLNIVQVVFDGGRNQANLDYYRARYREIMANYEETVVNAFKDVEDALVSLRQYARQAEDLAEAVKAAKETLSLAQQRYDRGLVNYLDVTDAERGLLQTEQNAVIVLGNRYTATVQLVKALGGGWCGCLCDCGLENPH